MARSRLRNAALTLALAAGGVFGAGDTGAQAQDTGATTDFRFDSAFALAHPDLAHWQPPPGGFLQDGRYTARTPADGKEIFLTIGTEYSGALLKWPEWQNDAFILSYHEQLLESELAGLRERGVDRAVATSSAKLDRRFSLPAIERRVLLNEVSASTGRATRTLVNYSWRFPHPSSPILELVVSISTVIDVGAPALDITADQLGFLASLKALPLDTAPDISVPLTGRRLDAIARGHSALWVTDGAANFLARIDPETREEIARLPVGAGPHSIEVTEKAVWVTNHNDDSIMRVDPLDNRVAVTASVPIGPHQILSHGSRLWLAADASCLITEIDPETAQPKGEPLSLGSVRRSLSGRRERLWGILGQRVGRCTDLSVTMAKADDGALYAFERFKGTLTRIDAAAGARAIETQAEIGGFLVTKNDLWGIDDLDEHGKVYRIDVQSGEILAEIEGGRVSGTPIAAGGRIWVARERENSVIRIDPTTSSITGSPIPVGGPAAMVADETGVWVAGATSVVHIPFDRPASDR